MVGSEVLPARKYCLKEDISAILLFYIAQRIMRNTKHLDLQRFFMNNKGRRKYRKYTQGRYIVK